MLAADRLFLGLVFLDFDLQSVGCRHPALVQPAGNRLEGTPAAHLATASWIGTVNPMWFTTVPTVPPVDGGVLGP